VIRQFFAKVGGQGVKTFAWSLLCWSPRYIERWLNGQIFKMDLQFLAVRAAGKIFNIAKASYLFLRVVFSNFHGQNK
jgi:hypothetical protein